MNDLHNIHSFIIDFYNRDSHIRDQHKKDSLIDGLDILVVEIINERILVVYQKGSSSSQDSVWRYASLFFVLKCFLFV